MWKAGQMLEEVVEVETLGNWDFEIHYFVEVAQ
jgi:hypothetical protein